MRKAEPAELRTKSCTSEDTLSWDADSCLMVRRCGCWHSRRWTHACKRCRWAAVASRRCCSDARQRPRRRTARLPRYRYSPWHTLLPQATAPFPSAKDCICDLCSRAAISAKPCPCFPRSAVHSFNRRGCTAASSKRISPALHGRSVCFVTVGQCAVQKWVPALCCHCDDHVLWSPLAQGGRARYKHRARGLMRSCLANPRKSWVLAACTCSLSVEEPCFLA